MAAWSNAYDCKVYLNPFKGENKTIQVAQAFHKDGRSLFSEVCVATPRKLCRGSLRRFGCYSCMVFMVSLSTLPFCAAAHFLVDFKEIKTISFFMFAGRAGDTGWSPYLQG